MLYACVITASDGHLWNIKDKKMEKARETHEVILSVINMPNLMKIMIDIFIYKIGGNKEKQRIYEYDI